MYLTLHLCPFMTLQRQMNVTDSSVGLCCIHFTIQLLATQLGAMTSKMSCYLKICVANLW